MNFLNAIKTNKMEYTIGMKPNVESTEISVDIDDLGYSLEEWELLTDSEKHGQLTTFAENYELGSIWWVPGEIRNEENEVLED